MHSHIRLRSTSPSIERLSVASAVPVTPSGAPQAVDRDVRRDAVQPRQRAGVAPERTDRTLRLLEYLLLEILGVGCAYEACQVTAYPVAVLAVEYLDPEHRRLSDHWRSVSMAGPHARAKQMGDEYASSGHHLKAP